MIDERQRQALVQRGQHQEHQQDREREHPQRRIAGQDLLVGELGPLVVRCPRGSVSAAMRSMAACAWPDE